MKRLSSVLVALAVLGTSACGGGEDRAEIMPAVESKRLDVAQSDLAAAGVDEADVEVLGGGAFGVVDESNWDVCVQEPAAGEPLSGSVRLMVERSCEPEATATPEATEDPTPEPTETTPEAVSESFTMPDLVGDNLQDAQNELQSLDSYLLRQNDATGQSRFQVLDSNWKVCGQDPAPGSDTPIETMVVLEAVKLEETCP